LQPLAKDELIKRGQENDWDVLSTGTWTMDGLPPMPEAILMAKQLGLDIQEHRSRAVTVDLLQDADLVLVMERGLANRVLSFPPKGCIAYRSSG
jgi:protein-tyrosine phosphatase